MRLPQECFWCSFPFWHWDPVSPSWVLALCRLSDPKKIHQPRWLAWFMALATRASELRMFTVDLEDNPTPNCSKIQDVPSKSLQSTLSRWTNTIAGKPYASFQGVQCAQPPLGKLRLISFIGSYVPQRFRNPQPFQSGEILYDVSGESTIQCPQLGGVRIAKHLR